MSRREERRARQLRRMQHKEMRAQMLRRKLAALYRIAEHAADPEERAWAEALHRQLGDCLDIYEEEIADLYIELEGIG